MAIIRRKKNNDILLYVLLSVFGVMNIIGFCILYNSEDAEKVYIYFGCVILSVLLYIIFMTMSDNESLGIGCSAAYCLAIILMCNSIVEDKVNDKFARSHIKYSALVKRLDKYGNVRITPLYNNVSVDNTDIKGDTMIVEESSDKERRIYLDNPSVDSIWKYSKPVKFENGEEFGNDNYYYAKLCPNYYLKNFGLNKASLDSDSVLYYYNINKSIESKSYICEISLQTSANREMVDTSGYAFYFHGEIVPKEQVFEEVPQAKEYYERYCGKAE